MKTITIDVTVKYTARVTTDVSDDVYNELMNVYEDGDDLADRGHAGRFLEDNISIADAVEEVEYQINDLHDADD